MKPLPTAPLTEDDELIWWRVALRAPWLPLQLPARAADRLDAELMLTAQRLRGLGFTDRWIAVPSLITVDWHAAGGALS